MSDNILRSNQWKALVGKFFSPRYGGSKQAWYNANEYALTQLIKRYEEKMKKNPLNNYRAYWHHEQILWLTDMFKKANIDPPPHEQRAKIAKLASTWITHRVNAAYKGVPETIRLLKNNGFTLYTASGEVSWELRGYLTRMGIKNCFNTLYGPDLINTAKVSVDFYEKIFYDSGVNPREVMIIDDSAEKLSWAAELGATIVHVKSFKKCTNTTCQHHVDHLNELPNLISKFTTKT